MGGQNSRVQTTLSSELAPQDLLDVLGPRYDNAVVKPSDLLEAVLDLERHVEADGWDQPPLLFALVSTAEIRASHPDLAAQLGVTHGGPGLTSFEQEPPPTDQPLDEFLAKIEWPQMIAGAAIVVERLVLPPDVEVSVTDRPDAASAAKAHPDARDMRIVAATSRNGSKMCAVRLRGAPDEAVLTGKDLVPGLTDALALTFR